MLIGEDGISNDVITLGTCFSMFVYIRARFRFFADWRKSNSSVDGEPQGNRRSISNSREVVGSSPRRQSAQESSLAGSGLEASQIEIAARDLRRQESTYPAHNHPAATQAKLYPRFPDAICFIHQ